MPCARLGWPSRQLLTTLNILYRTSGCHTDILDQPPLEINEAIGLPGFAWRVVLKPVCDVCNRYALDWLRSEGIVRVLCGSQSQITCTLKLHHDYPTVSSVTLQSATGLPPDFNLNTIQVSDSSHNITSTVV